MIDIDLVRRRPSDLRRALERRGEDPAVVDELARLDDQRRGLVAEADQLREHRNEASKAIGTVIKQGGDADAAREDVRRLSERLKEIEDEERGAGEALRSLLLTIPNPPNADVPDGKDETANIILRQEGEPRTLDFEARAHWDLAQSLGIVDMERGAKLSGSRFYVFGEMGARLQRALVQWMLDLHRTEHGYHEVGVPLLVRAAVMEGAGNLPKFADNLYHDGEDDLWLIPTAEVPLTGLHRDEILEPGTLPLRYMAHSPCFRREKTAGGRDTRGIKRVHQFEKVEMYQLTAPEDSAATLDALVGHAEEVCRRLGIAHRVLQLCTGDLGFQSAKSFDIEMWSPGSQEWLEVSTCSTCGDFQARRASIRFRREAGSRPEPVHTLNGSGLALPRVMIAIIENYQRPDGSVEVPDVLVPYLGQTVLEPVN